MNALQIDTIVRYRQISFSFLIYVAVRGHHAQMSDCTVQRFVICAIDVQELYRYLQQFLIPYVCMFGRQVIADTMTSLSEAAEQLAAQREASQDPKP